MNAEFFYSGPVVIIDLDNLVLGDGLRRRLNFFEIEKALKRIRATECIAYAGFIGDKESKRLRDIGVRSINTFGNADAEIIAKAKSRIKRGKPVVVVSGDGDLCLEVKLFSEFYSGDVRFWSRCARASKRISICRYVDNFIIKRRRNDWAWLDCQINGSNC